MFSGKCSIGFYVRLGYYVLQCFVGESERLPDNDEAFMLVIVSEFSSDDSMLGVVTKNT